MGQSAYKESLLRARDAAHTMEDVALWQSHDLASSTCELSAKERLEFEKKRVHMFCENRKAGMFSGQRLGEHVSERESAHVLRIWSVESSHMAERHKCERYGQLRRVVHLAVAVVFSETSDAAASSLGVSAGDGPVPLSAVDAVSSSLGGSAGDRRRSANAAEVGGVSAGSVEYVVVGFPGYSGPEMVPGPPPGCCCKSKRHYCAQKSRLDFAGRGRVQHGARAHVVALEVPGPGFRGHVARH